LSGYKRKHREMRVLALVGLLAGAALAVTALEDLQPGERADREKHHHNVMCCSCNVLLPTLR
jgi:hypothetical protein